MVNLPEPEGPSGQRFGHSVEYYKIGSFCSTPDGSGAPYCVAIEIKVKSLEWPFFLRLKTKEAVDTMIAALERHRDDVWPTGH